MPIRLGIIVIPTELVIKPGETITLYEPKIVVQPEALMRLDGIMRVDTPTICVAPEKYKIAFGGMIQSHPKLKTGTVEFEVQEPAKPVTKEAEDKRPPHIIEKPDMKGILSKGPSGATEAGGVVVKSFFALTQLHHERRLREFFDPRYLKKHGLTDRDIAFEFVDYFGIHNILVADDKYTVLAVLDLKGGGKEAFVMRCVVYEGHIYISPENAPDPKTGIFKPWILRTKVK
jgi:hypothetical protein